MGLDRFRIRIRDDGSVHWYGVDAGKTKVLAMNEDSKLIALHKAGGTFWHGVGLQSYSPASINIHQYEDTKLPDEKILIGLFGELEFKPRGNEWTPPW